MDLIFSKFNSGRKPKYQISTAIYKDNGNMICTKRALRFEGKEHIKRIAKNTDPRQKIINLDDDSVTFEYVNGKTVSQALSEAADKEDKNTFYILLNKYKDYILNKKIIMKEQFCPCREFVEIFGQPHMVMEKVECLVNANIDLLFSNIVINDKDEWIAIDNEWIFDFEIPIKYVIFRALTIFRYSAPKCIDIQELLSYFNISDEESEIFRSFDDNFYSYIAENTNVLQEKKIILYGAGYYGKKALDYYGGEQVFAFADRNKAGCEYHGKPVIHPASLENLYNEYDIIVCVQKYDDVVDYLRSMGISKMLLLPFISKNFQIILPDSIM